MRRRRALVLGVLLAATACKAQEAPPPAGGSGAAAARPHAPTATVAVAVPAPVAATPQLDQLVRDRPKLRATLASRPEIRAWLAGRFGGSAGGVMVDWDPSAPRSGQLAEHLQPQVTGGHATLRIAETDSGFDQLTGAIFEMLNMESGAEFTALWGQALAHAVTRQAFAEGMARLEHRALRRFKVFAKEHALVPGDGDAWTRSMLAAPDDYAKFHQWILDARGYGPEIYWARAYDSIPAPDDTHRSVEAR